LNQDISTGDLIHRPQRFTLIEVVTVVVVVAMLGALVLPRIAGKESQARSTALDGLGGSVRSGAAWAHAIWRERGTSPGMIFMQGIPIEMDVVTGYPDATRAGIRRVIESLDGFTGTVVEGGGYRFGIIGSSLATCNVTYRLGSSSGQPPAVEVTNDRQNGGDCS